jgi:hypothetical protein
MFLPKNNKILSSQNEKLLFSHETINFNYGHNHPFLHKLFGFLKNGQKKCPKKNFKKLLRFQNWVFLKMNFSMIFFIQSLTFTYIMCSVIYRSSIHFL